MSTIGEHGTERCVELAREHALEFVDAPVLGTKAPAESGELVDPGLGGRAHPGPGPADLRCVGKRTMWVGEAGTGTLLKLATNSWIVAVVEGGAETLALAEGLGLDPQLVLDAIEGGPLDLPYLRMKAKSIMERDFDPSFRLALAAKDAALVEEAAERRHLDLPLVRTISARLQEGVAEHGDKDMSATYLTSAPAELPSISPAITTTSWRGPWTPSTRDSSMSEVADGPETKVTGARRSRTAGASRAIASGTCPTT